MAINGNWRRWTEAGLRARAYKTFDSAEGKRLRRIKGARHAHATIRAGRGPKGETVPGEKARAAALLAKRFRREEKERAAQGLAGQERTGQANVDGI